MSDKKDRPACEHTDFWDSMAADKHVVQIYENDLKLIDTLEDFAADAFERGEPALFIATREHRRTLEQRLLGRGFDIPNLTAKQQYIFLDATDTLSKFMVKGVPHEKLFFETIEPVIRGMQQGSVRIRAFGEMVALLWECGERSAAIQLEHLWNKLFEKEDFLLLCAYPKSGFKDDAGASVIHICSAHARVIDFDAARKEESYKQVI